MPFRITGLPAAPFSHLFGLSDLELAGFDAMRIVVDTPQRFSDRIEMRDALPGETVILVNYEHLPARNPYRSRHAVFVLEGAEQSYDRIDEVPDVLRRRDISVRGFDGDHMIVDADLVNGYDTERAIERLFADARVCYIHAHYAKYGCYACRIDRE